MMKQKTRQNKNKISFSADLQQKKEKENAKKREISISPRIIKLMPFIYGALFCIISWIFLTYSNGDYLYAVQERSLFLDTSQFFEERTSVPGGFLEWVGCFLTQLFYYPWLGALVLVLLWGIIIALSFRAFKIPAKCAVLTIIPPALLLCSVVDLGYWMYYIKLPGYWFTGTVGFTVTVLATAGYTLLKTKTAAREAVLLLWTCLAYPLFGWYALLATVYMLIIDLTEKDLDTSRKAVRSVVAVLSIILVPIASYYLLYSGTRMADMWKAVFPIFESSRVISTSLSLPFVFMALLPAIYLALSRLLQTKGGCRPICGKSGTLRFAVAQLAVIAVAVAVVRGGWYDNYNFHSEHRMYKLADEQKWEDVLVEMAANPGTPTRQMVMCKNIALMKVGRCGNEMFRYSNEGEPPYVFDSLRVKMVETAAPMIYYNYGRCNFCYRWCIENSVEYGFNVNGLKYLIRSSILSGEYKVAEKYINMLKHTTFHKEWAEHFEQFVRNPKLIAQNEEFKLILPLRKFKDVLDGDEGLCEMYLLNYFSNSQNPEPMFQEQTLVYALVSKDIDRFWKRFFQYATLHIKEPMPIHYQEAAFLYGNLEKTVDISKMPFDRDRILGRFANFQRASQMYAREGMSVEQMGEAMRPEFGDTFWWFYFFCKGVKSY